MISIGQRTLRYVLAAATLLWHTWATGAALDPASFPSLGGSPFGAGGTYVINTSNPPTMTGPTGTFFGFVTAENVAVFTFDSVSIGAGVVVRVIGGRPAAILSHASFLMSGGEINASGTYDGALGQYVPGAGGASGGLGGSGGGPGGGGGGAPAGPAGGGGAGFGTSGGTGGGGGGGPGGIVYGNLSQTLQGGSGGGGGTAPSFGGPSGGAVEIGAADSINIAGTIRADGYAGQPLTTSGGGGGSGGGLLLHAQFVTISGIVRASGGNGGDGTSGGVGGGGGAPGRIHVLTASGSMTIVQGAIISLAGGSGGAGLQPGLPASSSTYIVGILPPPTTTAAVAGCIKISGTALVGVDVAFKQRGQAAHTTTDNNGCYEFISGTSGRTGTITIELPALP